MRRNPFEEIEELFDRMETQFETSTSVGGGSVAIDLVDHGDEFVLTADLPGYDPEDIDLTYSDGRLHLVAHHDESEAVTDDQYVRQERRHRSAERTITVPDPIDEEGIEASHNNGVLTVTLPKEDVGDDGKTIDIE